MLQAKQDLAFDFNWHCE